MNSSKRGFTLVELLVVVGMIAVILGAMTTSITAAQNRARIQKATSDVKVISQAILAYENFSRGSDFKLEQMGGIGKNGADADANTLGFLIGDGKASDSGVKIPALLMASLQSGGKMKDPWGTPYKLHIKEKQGTTVFKVASGSLRSGFFLPNFYRLSEEERDL